MLKALDIDAVVLDAGGVLVLPDPAWARAALAQFGVSPSDEQCRRSHYAGNVAIDDADSFDWDVIDRVIAHELGVPTEHREEAGVLITELYQAAPWVPVAGAAEALRAFASAGYRLAIVSNAFGTMEAQLAQHEICSTQGGQAAQVEIVVDSTVVGVEKPDPAIFHVATEALDLPPSRCAYVGDTIHFDVNGARSAGLRPIHLDPYRWCRADDHPHVSCLEELL